MSKKQAPKLGPILASSTSGFAAADCGAYRLLAEVDFVAKLALALCWSGEEIALGRFAGLGEVENALRLTAPTVPALRAVKKLAVDLLRSQVNLPGRDTRNVLQTRNLLFHGDLYDRSELTQVASALRKRVSETLGRMASEVNRFTIVRESGIQFLYPPGGEKPSPLEPLAVVDEGGATIGVLANTFSGRARYTSPGTPTWLGKSVGWIRDQYPQVLAPEPKHITVFEHFRTSVYDDIGDLCLEGSAFEVATSDRHLVATWLNPEGPKNAPRTDFFRVGEDDRREWLAQSEGAVWRGYKDLLREVCSWQEFAERLETKTALAAEQIRKAEEESIPLPPGVVPERVQATFEPTHPLATTRYFYGIGDKSPKLLHELDDCYNAAADYTQIYFVHADAGMGKTTELVHMARHRLAEVRNDPLLAKPIILYTSAFGRIITNVNHVVATAVDGIRVVDSRSVHALLRNGLVVLIIDGLDDRARSLDTVIQPASTGS